MIPIWSRLGPLGKWHVGLGLLVAFLGSLTAPRGHVTGGLVLMVTGVTVAATTVSLWFFGSRPRPVDEPAAPATSKPNQRGLATTPPDTSNWSE